MTPVSFNASDRDLTALLRLLKPTFILVLTDTNTRKLCLSIFEPVINKFKNVGHVTIQAGERYKNFESVQKVLDELLTHNAGKDSLIINLGGGMITDIGGFAASIYKRGIRYINIPTTLLAQCDAAIGGKTGINVGSIKNSVGTIHQPIAAAVNTAYLDTLKTDEGLNGLAEMMKHALLDGSTHWKIFLQFLDGKVMLPELLQRSIDFKLKVVKRDPLEKDYRQILNFGHTVGHAVEAYMLSQRKPIKHGFAVAFGMNVAMRLSEKYFKLKQSTFEQARDVLETLFPSLNISAIDVPLIMKLMLHDKKVKGSKLNFVLLEGIGKPKINCVVQPKDVEAAMRELLMDS